MKGLSDKDRPPGARQENKHELLWEEKMRGSIIKRGKSSYTVVLNLGNDPTTGKRKQQWVSVKGTKKEAIRAAYPN